MRIDQTNRTNVGRAIRFVASLVLVGALAGAGGAGRAQTAHGAHGDHAAHGGADASPSTAAYRDANMRMHADMDVPFTGDPDVDFARAMIPHHEGAVAMAEIVLEYGADQEMRAFAESVIEAQSAEIEMLRAWLAAQEQ